MQSLKLHRLPSVNMTKVCQNLKGTVQNTGGTRLNKESRHSAWVIPNAASMWGSPTDENHSPLRGNVRHCLAALALCVRTASESASPVGPPKLHLARDAVHVGSQAGGACWSVWRQVGVGGGSASVVMGVRVRGGHRRVTGLPGAEARTSGKDPPSNHLRETGVWEDNYKYSCQRRHISIDALEWDQQRCIRRRVGEMERQGRHEKLDRREQLIKSLVFCVSFHVPALFA